MNAWRTLARAAGAVVWLGFSAATPAVAHPLAPSLRTLREASDGSVTSTLRVPLPAPRGLPPTTRLPERCHSLAPATTRFEGRIRFVEERFDCRGSLAGETIEASGIEDGLTQQIVRVERIDGSIAQGLLTARTPRFVVPVQARARDLVQDQIALGATHLLGGLDHLLFLVGLALLARGRRLVLAISGFTAGHAVSFSLVAWQGALPAPALVEIAIAITLVALGGSLGVNDAAGERALDRRPALWPLGFGLIHGLGFAAALSEAGLPRDALPLAVASFHAGIELAQLALVLLALPLVSRLSRQLSVSPERFRVMCAHGIGGVGAWLVLDRAATLLGLG